MSRPRLIIGIDPGPVPGIAGLWFHETDTRATEARFTFAQCDVVTCLDILDTWLRDSKLDTPNILIATEKFVVSARSARSATASAGITTRAILQSVHDEVRRLGITLVTRPAATVKPWADNERLNAAGLYRPTTGSTHARDAARHALYAAVHDGLYLDPLKRKKER